MTGFAKALCGLFVLVAMSAAASAQTSTAEPPEEEMICVTILTLWSGGLQDVRDIAAVPVPGSYRRMLGGGPCNSLDVPSLITWNLSFGDERSTTAALRYLEQSPQRKVPDPDLFLRDLEKRWSRDLPAYRAAEARRSAHPGRGADIAFGRDPVVRRALARRETTENFILLAGQYLRAAEFFSSAALLDRAATYLEPPIETLRVTAGDTSIAMADDSDIPLPPYRVNDVRDLEMRAAVLKARLSRAPADIAAAKAMLDAKDVAVLRKAAENAYENGDGICEVGDEEHLAAIKKACDDENDFGGRVLRYWRVRAQLDLLGDGPVQQRTHGFDLALKLLQHELRDPWEAVQGSIREQAADDMAALLLQRFEAENATADAVAHTNPVLAEDEQRRQRSYALGFLIRAERFAPPTENASRFRQIAERYIAVWRGLAPSPETGEALSPALAREAAYLERVLSALPQIGSGDVAPSK